MVEKTFSIKFSKALTDKGIPDDRSRRGTVAKMFGVSVESVRKWLAGEALPETTRLQAISDKLGVSIDWLLSKKNNDTKQCDKPYLKGQPTEPIPVMEPNPRIQALIGLFEGLTTKQQDEMIRWAEKQEQANREVIDELKARVRGGK